MPADERYDTPHESTVKVGPLSQDELMRFLSYNETTGIFVWKIGFQHGPVKTGCPAGTKASSGYIVIAINRKKYFAHRLAWQYIHGEVPGGNIDHINGLKHDNRIENLRIATKSQNAANSKVSTMNTSGVKGVSWSNKAKKWVVQVRDKGKKTHVGCFSDLHSAKLAASDARAKVFGEFDRGQ